MPARNQQHRFACCGLALLLIATCCARTAGAQLVAPARIAAEQGREGFRISGRVVDAHSGATLPRCNVEIVDVKQARGSRSLLTGEDGRFTFDGLSASKYRLSASKRGFLTQAYEEHDNYSTAIAVGPGLVSQDLLFKLTPGAIVSGTVTDEAGEPVRQAQITLFRDQDLEGVRSTLQQGQAMTDDRGVYELAGIRPGAYFLSVSAHPWYALQRDTNSGSDPDRAALDVAYPTTYYPDVTDADAATPIPIKGGERVQADFILHAARAMHLRIPMSEAEMRNGFGISISHSVFGEPENLPLSSHSVGSGAMVTDGLLPGHYDVLISKNVAGQQTTTRYSADVTGASAELSPVDKKDEVTVRGKVISSEGKLPPRSGISLVVLHSRRAYLAPVDDAGEFTITVPAGIYEVLGQINHHYLAEISAEGAALVGRVLTIRAGTSPRLQVMVGNSYGQIDGTVVHDGHPASAAMVLLVPDHPGENHILFRRDQSDSDGTFTLLGILPGHYRLVAIERGWDLEWANPRVLAPFLSKGRPVDVRGNDHLRGTIELQTR
jgi:protocatechuate 3,4-dioxygenase beta subunit